MATQVGKPGGPMLTRGGLDDVAREKPKDNQELGLFLALIALLAWALFVIVRAVDWPAVSHALGSLLAMVR
jgi:hypothetical protein